MTEPAEPSRVRLEIVPCTISEAKAFVDQHHRHHIALAVALGDRVVGVAIVGRPVARGNQTGWTAEVTRCCVLDGVPNACSKLYGAAWRATRAIGYRKLITYTLASESGTTLKAAGWKVIAEVKGRSWSCPTRPRIDKHPTQGKLRWEVTA